jgi:predicted CoA-binding protein
MTKEEVIREFVCRPSRIAVVGASPSRERPVSAVMAYLLERDFRLFPVNPAYTGQKVLGLDCTESLRDLPQEVDVVALFVGAKNQEPVLRDLHALPFRPVVWMQPGAENAEAEKALQAEGFSVVSGACLMATHRALCRKIQAGSSSDS